MTIEVIPSNGDPKFNIDLSSKDCVEEGTYDYIGFTPKVKSFGMYYNIGVAFSF